MSLTGVDFTSDSRTMFTRDDRPVFTHDKNLASNPTIRYNMQLRPTSTIQPSPAATRKGESLQHSHGLPYARIVSQR